MSRSRAALPVLALLTLAACGSSGDAPVSSVPASSAPAPPRTIATPTPEPTRAAASGDPPALAPSVASPTASEPVRVDPPCVSADAAGACDDLVRVAVSHVPELTRCFDAESQTTPDLFALLQVRLVLRANGTVESVTVHPIYPGRFEDAVTRLERCVHASVRTWTFALSERPASVVAYAIDFDRRVLEPVGGTLDSEYATGEGTVGLGNLGAQCVGAPYRCQPL